MDESFDVENFEIPLNEKRTYTIIEVFQVKWITFNFGEIYRNFKIVFFFIPAMAANIQRNVPTISKIVVFSFGK